MWEDGSERKREGAGRRGRRGRAVIAYLCGCFRGSALDGGAGGCVCVCVCVCARAFVRAWCSCMHACVSLCV